MLKFLSQDLTIAKRSPGRTEEGSSFGASLLHEASGLLQGSNFLIWGLAESPYMKPGRLKNILQYWPCKLWSFLRLTSIVHYEMKKELGICTLWVNFDISLDWDLTGRFWCWAVATLQPLYPEACMSNTSLWALAINLWNGARTGEENRETALDFLMSCWIKKQWEALSFLTKGSSPLMKFPAAVSMLGTVPPHSRLQIHRHPWVSVGLLPSPGVFQATSPDYVTLIQSRCCRMLDRRGQMALEKKSISVFMTLV